MTAQPERVDGLAVYRVGRGRPTLLMPYPHGFMLEPMVRGSLGQLLIGLGRSIVSFDPPGSFESTRRAEVTMDEMLDCAGETLTHFGLSEPVDLVGHSMGSLCAIGFALAHPERVGRIVLVGTLSGWPAVWQHGRHRAYGWMDARYWRLAYYGIRVQYNWGSLKTFKQLYNLMEADSFANRDLAPRLTIEPGDEQRPIPVRMRWTQAQRSIDYRPRLAEITQPVLVCAGQHDIETPPILNREVAEGVQNGRIVLFDQSGHSPFIEEPQRFASVVAEFLG